MPPIPELMPPNVPPLGVGFHNTPLDAKRQKPLIFQRLSLILGLHSMSVAEFLVGTTGFEPATSSVSRKRSNQLSYAPELQPIQFIRKTSHTKAQLLTIAGARSR